MLPRPAQVDAVLPGVTHLALHAVQDTLYLNESLPYEVCSLPEARQAAAAALLHGC
jgi:hypothetical protein